MKVPTPPRLTQTGLSLVELLVALALGLTVMGGVVSVLLLSKNNFVSERELAALQENARFAVRYMSDSLMMAGFSGCGGAPLYVANSVPGSDSNVFLAGTGLHGFDHSEGSSVFPTQFRADVAPGTDAVLVRWAENAGLSVSSHNGAGGVIHLNKPHANRPGQVMVMASADCQQVGVLVMSGPNNASGSATTIEHNSGSGNGSGANCTTNLGGSFDCGNAVASVRYDYLPGSSVRRLRSEAFYVGTSSVGNGIPALFREHLTDSGTTAEELVQGVENLRIQYGLDNALSDGRADIYLDAGDPAMNWDNVVSVRLSLRMRSVNPVYNQEVAYPAFRDVAGTAGSDRYMRQLVSTTVRLRNRIQGRP